MRFFAVLWPGGSCVFAAAQLNSNSWIGSTSGNWEDPEWSLGAPPGTNQTVFLTNAG
ncbi:MAG TPA: hypothetical protein VH595_08195 [Verrucomicrobiae bacterium]|nr:hypothetical protein [Verrucomicrobiae bacterium]